MKLKNQVCSLELAKRLKELGVKQDSMWYWNFQFEYSSGEKVYGLETIINNRSLPMYTATDMAHSAFTVAELGKLLPFFIVNKGELIVGKNYRRHLLTGWNVQYKQTVNCKGEPLPVICGNTEANARASMLKYLWEEKLI